MNVSLNNNLHLPTELPVALPVGEGGQPAAGGESPATVGLTVAEGQGPAPIPGEEPVDEKELTRDDALGQLVSRALAPSENVLEDIGFLPEADAATTVAENIGKSADELKALFIRNREAAEEEARRLEARLKTEAAKVPDGDERLDALLREAELKV